MTDLLVHRKKISVLAFFFIALSVIGVIILIVGAVTRDNQRFDLKNAECNVTFENSTWVMSLNLNNTIYVQPLTDYPDTDGTIKCHYRYTKLPQSLRPGPAPAYASLRKATLAGIIIMSVSIGITFVIIGVLMYTQGYC